MQLPKQQWKGRGALTVAGRAVLHDEVTLVRSHQNYEPLADAIWVWPEQHVARIIAECFGRVPNVRSICAQFGSEGFTVWTLLESRDPEAREQVYEQELKICEMINSHDFDFRVTSIDIVSSDELVKTGFSEIFSRK